MSDQYVPSPKYSEYDEQREIDAYAASHDYANKLQYVTRTSPWLADDPEVLNAIAQMNLPVEQMGYMGAQASAMMRLDGLQGDLEQMEPGRARVVWQQLTRQQQDALRAQGYNPPAEAAGGSNPLLSAAGTIGAGVLGGVNTVITKTPLVSDVFDLMWKIENGVKTLYRGIRTDDEAQLATAAAIVGGIAAAPFTGGLSLTATIGAIGAAGLTAGTAVAIATNPSDYIEALDDNWNGEAVFSREAQIESRKLLADTGLDTLARDVGWELDAWETVKLFASTPEATSEQAFAASIERVLDRVVDAGDARRPELAGALMQLITEPAFRDAVAVLQRSKVSFGRDVARALNLDPGSSGYRYLSGGLDAVFTIALDPTLAGAGYLKWNRARRLGVPLQAGEDVFQTIQAIEIKANSIPKIGRAYDELAAAVNNDTPHTIFYRVPHLKGVYQDLWDYKRLLQEQGALDGDFTREHIFRYMNDSTMSERMLAGYGVRTGFGRLILPTYGTRVPFTQSTVALGKWREYLKATIDFADDKANLAHLKKVAQKMEEAGEEARSITVVDNAAPGTELVNVIEDTDEYRYLRSMVDFIDKLPVARTVMRSTGQLLASFTEMMPATNSISLVGPQSFDEIKRMVGLGRVVGIDSVSRRQWFDYIIQQDNVEHRTNAAMAFLNTMLSAGGMRSSDRGQELLEQFINKTRHRYSLGSDEYLLGQRQVSRAIHPYQHAYDLPVPDLKELRQYVEKGVFLKYLHRATDAEFIDLAVNKIWKPAVLLRVGFIVRAGGEELLAHLARVGPSAMLNEFGARAIAEGKLYEGLDKTILTAAQREQVAHARYLAHVRPLERMFAGYEYAHPVNDVLRRYSDMVRTGLERGWFQSSWLENSRYNVALLGKEGSIRRTLMVGIDPQLVDNMMDFTGEFATTIMRDLSSQNASVAAELRQGDFSMSYRDSTDELQELGYVPERGEFRTYTAEGDAGDDLFDRMAHSSLAKIVSDPVTGPQYVRVTSRWAPSTITDLQASESLRIYRQVDDRRLQRVFDELLTHNDARTTNWDSLIEYLRETSPQLADRLSFRAFSLGESPDDAARVFDAVEEWIRETYPGRSGALSKRGEQLMQQTADMRRLLDAWNTVGPQERAWLGSFVGVWGKTPDSPALIRSFDEFRSELVARNIDVHFDPEIQPQVQGLTYVNRMQDGTFVARPPRQGMTRVFVPQVTAESYGRILHALRTEGPDQFVRRMMAMWGEAQPHLTGLHIAQADQVLERFLTRMALDDINRLASHAADVASAGKHGDLIPLGHMAFDDPDLAQRFSQFIDGMLMRSTEDLSTAARMQASPGFVAQLDLDDNLRHYTPTDVDGAKRPIAYRQYEQRVSVVEPARTIEETVGVPRFDEAALPPYPDWITVDGELSFNLDALIRPGGLTNKARASWVDSTLNEFDPTQIEFHFVGGGRNYNDAAAMQAHLQEVQALAAEQGRRVVVVHGGARGADSLAGAEAARLGIPSITFPAEWDALGKSAGFQRNEEMARFLARARDQYGFTVHGTPFPGGDGTAHMTDQLTNAGIDVVDVQQYAGSGVTTTTHHLPEVTAVERGAEQTAERVVHAWALDREMLTPRMVSMADQPLVTLADGTRQYGADPRAAIAEGVERATDDFIAHIADTNQTRIVKGEVYRRPGRHHRIKPGTQLRSRDVVYDAEGKVVRYDNREAFDILEPDMNTNYVHENWSMIGPLLRDGADTHAGRAHLVRDTRNFRNGRGSRTGRVRADEAIRQAVSEPKIREFRGHWSQMKGLKNAPKVVIAPALRHVEAPTRWEKILTGAFEGIISPAIDGIVRRPMAAHYFHEAMQENRHATRWLYSTHLFGDEYTGEPGELAARFGSLLEHQFVSGVSDAALAADVRHIASIVDDDLADAFRSMDDAAVVQAWYGQWGDDTISQGVQTDLLAGLQDSITTQVQAARRAYWSNVQPDEPLAKVVGKIEQSLRGEQRTRLYKTASGSWSPRKPRNIEGAVYVDVPKSRVSSTLATLNGPTPSAAFPTYTALRRETSTVRARLASEAEDAIEQGARGARPYLADTEYAGVTQRRHLYSREGYIRSKANGGMAPDEFVQEYGFNIGVEFGSVDEGLEHYFRLIDHKLAMRKLGNDLAIQEVAERLGIDHDIVRAAMESDNASDFRHLLGDRPGSGPEYDRTVEMARELADDTPPVRPGGPTADEAFDLVLSYVTTGRLPAGAKQHMFDEAAKLVGEIDQYTKKFQLAHGVNLESLEDAIEAGRRAMQVPRWSIVTRNNPRPIEGVLDAYEFYLGDAIALDWERAQQHLGNLPAALREPLDKDSWAVLSAAQRNRANVERTVRELAAQRAIANGMPYLDSHEIRSQAGEYVRGFFPFMYAEENFLKRWGRTLVIAPDALRKGQLLYMGLKSGGVIRTDSQGRDWFVYPGAGMMADVVNRTTQAIGWGEVMPSGVVFQSQTNQMLPGFDFERTGMPGANPLVAVSVGGLASMFHELRPVHEALVGQAGLASGGINQFMPAAARRFFEAFSDQEGSVKFASAMMSAIAVLEANGHGLPEGATKNQLDDYIRRVRNHTRGILMTQAIVGFVTPASPAAQFTGQSQLSKANLTGMGVEIPADLFRNEYLLMVRELGIEEGTIAYFELNPDHDIYDLMAFTQGQSDTPSGAPLPVTHESVKFADENPAFLEQYPMAAAWLLPQTQAGDEDFDEYAYVQQSISGLRQKNTPTEFLEALKYREGALGYFNSQEDYELEMARNADNPLNRKRLTDAWETYKARWFAMHPVFHEQLQGGEARARRARVLQEMRLAVEDPGAPRAPHYLAMQDLIRAFDEYQRTVSTMSEDRSVEAQERIRRYRQRFSDRVQLWLLDHPEMQPFWLSVIKPEADL